jgi:hypothetical protein
MKPEEIFPMPWDNETENTPSEVKEFTDEEARKYDDFSVGNI